VPLAFANVSNATVIGLLTAGSGSAAGNFNGTKNFGLSPSVRIPNTLLPRAAVAEELHAVEPSPADLPCEMLRYVHTRESCLNRSIGV
jgi:hypothetical protein